MKILRSVVVTVRSRIEGSRVLLCVNSENEPFSKFTLTANLEQTPLDPRDVKYYHEAEKSIVDFASLLVPRRMPEGPYVFAVDRYTCAGHVTFFPEDDDEENEYTMLNIVFFLQKDFYVPSVVDGLVAASRMASAALLAEERRSGFVTTQVHKIFSVRKRFCQENARRAVPLLYKDLIHELIQQSELAAVIQDLFVDIKTTGVSHIRINRRPVLPISLNNFAQITSQELFPDNTLFLFKSPGQWIDDLQASTAPFAAHTPLAAYPDFLAHTKTVLLSVSPVKSFAFLASTTEIPLREIYDIARYLVFWGKARVIDALSLGQVYVLTKTKPPLLSQKGKVYVSDQNTTYQTVLVRPSSLASKFRDECEWHDLPRLLRFFDRRRSLDAIVELLDEAEQDAFLEAVTWLVAHGVLTRLRTFLIGTPRPADAAPDEPDLACLLPFVNARDDLGIVSARTGLSADSIRAVVARHPDELLLVDYE